MGGLTGFAPIPGALSPRELAEADLPALQAFLDAHPAYYLAVTGAPAPPDEARRAFDEPPPAGTGWTRRWFLGLHDDAGALQGHAIVVADLFAPGTWHVALFLVATALHGSGVAAATLAGLEAWMAGQGARWGRLGVVVGHARAERFWTRHGWREVRVRPGVDVGGVPRDVSVRVKPLAPDAGTIDAYLARVPRDRPGAP